MTVIKLDDFRKRNQWISTDVQIDTLIMETQEGDKVALMFEEAHRSIGFTSDQARELAARLLVLADEVDGGS